MNSSRDGIKTARAGLSPGSSLTYRREIEKRGRRMRRFLVRAKSVNEVRRALGRAPGGVRVVGRFDRETIECVHTMEAHSLSRHWPIVLSRLTSAGLSVVPRGETDITTGG